MMFACAGTALTAYAFGSVIATLAVLAGYHLPNKHNKGTNSSG
jgi:hypothetical protein